ncbi:MAG TPA: citrate lyase holo-[acyl-carrier protein] synthase [Clostridiaceae bacterium]|nr:citrate lyase holo-[acyl-carrier protein] synthase [Clostridiaceae bacterium]
MDIENKNLSEILLGREERVEIRKKLSEIYKTSLVCFTLNIPGADKNSPLFIKVHETGIEALKKETCKYGMKIVYEQFGKSAAGPEAFFCIDAEPLEIKKLTVSIEENHKLGRLFDFDVFDKDDKHLDRVKLGFPERKCFICGERVAICSRSRRHSVNELLNKIYHAIDEYYQL